MNRFNEMLDELYELNFCVDNEPPYNIIQVSERIYILAKSDVKICSGSPSKIIAEIKAIRKSQSKYAYS